MKQTMSDHALGLPEFSACVCFHNSNMDFLISPPSFALCQTSAFVVAATVVVVAAVAVAANVHTCACRSSGWPRWRSTDLEPDHTTTFRNRSVHRILKGSSDCLVPEVAAGICRWSLELHPVLHRRLCRVALFEFSFVSLRVWFQVRVHRYL